MNKVLDTVALFGVVPPRFGWEGGNVSLDTYFTLARGSQEKETSTSREGKVMYFASCLPPLISFQVGALEMLKWFDTNYHYLVPEFHSNTKFAISSSKVFDEFAEALSLGITTKPVLVGPITFLTLGKPKEDFDHIATLLPQLLPLYIEVIERLAKAGAQWIQIDEPVLVNDLTEQVKSVFKYVCNMLSRHG